MLSLGCSSSAPVEDGAGTQASGGASSSASVPQSFDQDRRRVALPAADGWLRRAQNDAGIQGPFFTYGDEFSNLELSTSGGCVAAAGHVGAMESATSTEHWGAGVGVNLNQESDSTAAFDASQYLGIELDLSGDFRPVRFALQQSDGTEYCTEGLGAGHHVIEFAKLQRECWSPGGPTPSDASMRSLGGFRWHVPARVNTPADVQFSICELALISRQSAASSVPAGQGGSGAGGTGGSTSPTAMRGCKTPSGDICTELVAGDATAFATQCSQDGVPVPECLPSFRLGCENADSMSAGQRVTVSVYWYSESICGQVDLTHPCAKGDPVLNCR